MVHHSIAVVITSFLTNFVVLRLGEVRRIYLPRTPVNRGSQSTHDSSISRPCTITVLARLAWDRPRGSDKSWGSRVLPRSMRRSGRDGGGKAPTGSPRLRLQSP
jgi:hypothetical protein